MFDITQTTEYAREEERLKTVRRRINEITGYDYNHIDYLLSQNFTPEQIVNNYRKEEELIRERDDFEFRTIQQSIPKIPHKIRSVISSRIDEKKLEKTAPSTGYEELDRNIKGFIPGHLYAFTGDTNVGKTSMACNFACRLGMKGKRVLYFALEPDNTVADYLASIVTSSRFDQITEDHYDLIPDGIDIFTKEDVKSIDELVKIVKSIDRYDLIIIDHIGYFVRDSQNYNQKQSDVIKELAALSKAKQCAIMMIAHLRKGIKDIPTMDDISGSAAFKQDSTEVLIAIRDKDETDQFNITYKDTGYLLVTKTKSGRNGAMKIHFQNGGGTILSDKEVKNLGQKTFEEAKEIFHA